MAPSSRTLSTQVLVLGAGPGGYAAAFRAADLGLKTTILDDRPAPGGVCLNAGCIPSKALLHAAKVAREAREAALFGLSLGEPVWDLEKLRGWKESVVQRLTGGVRQLAKARGVQIVRGRGVFIDSERMRIEDGEADAISFENAIVATGSSPVIPKPLAIAHPALMDSTGALALESLPGSLLVCGGGYIGLEMATAYAAFGCRVTVVEMTDGLLPGADRDLVRFVSARMKEICEAVLLETKVASLTPEGKHLSAQLEGPEGARSLVFDKVLVAAGRRPNTSGLGLENTGARLDAKGFIQVNAARRTDDPRIWAIGDAAGDPMLAHKASREGRVAAESIAGRPSAFDPAAIPAVVFTDPELAWCGLTEDDAKRRSIPVRVSRFPWAASGRALTIERKDGVTKIVADPATGRILGAGIAGPGAGELIAELTLAMEMGASAEDVAATIHPHPTLSETVMEGAELIEGGATHVYRPRKAGE